MLLLDNHGGYSHAGRRIALHSDGTFTDTRYTDVVGDERANRGVYTLNDEKTHLTLSPARGEAEHLYRVDCSHQQYWVQEQDRSRITESGQSWLRQISLRVDQQ
jgi:hypothetical protein